MNEVVVTGMGVVSPVGCSTSDFTGALFSGQSGAGHVKRFDASAFPTTFAAEVSAIPLKHRDVKIDFALHAAQQAMQHAKLLNNDLPITSRAGVSMGIGLELFAMPDLIGMRYQQQKSAADALSQITFLNTPSDMCVHMISHQYRFNQAPLIHISACAASTDAIGSAFERIRYGQWDVALAGGTDSMINPLGMGGFCRIGALSNRNDSPTSASRPFDANRNGFLLGEGAGFIVLESAQHAQARNAPILARISGYGNSLDGYSVSDPHPDGLGAILAMQHALHSAGIRATEISAINAHGTSTLKNDPVETRAIRELLGSRVDQVPVFATKSMIGHLISASGAVESIASILCLQNNCLHHTINLQQVADDCQLNHVTGKPLALPLQHIMKNSFGFGGKNAVLIISKA